MNSWCYHLKILLISLSTGGTNDAVNFVKMQMGEMALLPFGDHTLELGSFSSYLTLRKYLVLLSFPLVTVD